MELNATVKIVAQPVSLKIALALEITIMYQNFEYKPAAQFQWITFKKAKKRTTKVQISSNHQKVQMAHKMTCYLSQSPRITK